MSELLKCPFCGGEAKPYNLGKKHLIECDDCKEYGHGAYVVARTEAEAIAAWNSRAERTCRNKVIEINKNTPLEWRTDNFSCSECGAMFFADSEHVNYPIDWAYCPNCGARAVSE